MIILLPVQIGLTPRLHITCIISGVWQGFSNKMSTKLIKLNNFPCLTTPKLFLLCPRRIIDCKCMTGPVQTRWKHIINNHFIVNVLENKSLTIAGFSWGHHNINIWDHPAIISDAKFLRPVSLQVYLICPKLLHI